MKLRQGEADPWSRSRAAQRTRITIPFTSSSSCDPGTWASAADTQAAASGIDVSAYPRRLYVMPSNSCGATGYGTMSSVPSSAWVFACDLKGAYAHELGHNLGMNHGSTPDMEYGDITDAMTSAASRLRPTNAPHRHQMGWLPGSAIRLATEGGVYYLAPLESNPALAASPQAIAVAKPDTGEYYLLFIPTRARVRQLHQRELPRHAQRAQVQR
jgi:hypothetical protein